MSFLAFFQEPLGKCLPHNYCFNTFVFPGKRLGSGSFHAETLFLLWGFHCDAPTRSLQALSRRTSDCGFRFSTAHQWSVHCDYPTRKLQALIGYHLPAAASDPQPPILSDSVGVGRQARHRSPSSHFFCMAVNCYSPTRKLQALIRYASA